MLPCDQLGFLDSLDAKIHSKYFEKINEIPYQISTELLKHSISFGDVLRIEFNRYAQNQINPMNVHKNNLFCLTKNCQSFYKVLYSKRLPEDNKVPVYRRIFRNMKGGFQV
ncbi:CLUMA_CG007181, isoform A [Clunio marinus]|uniref:CLUMA_CG007181, isoform A n=1 Tax=Clunio marinus TaxID=568069 RepID=A0A1J1I239_9DIPT|nr:CLUMA_CG007181, isoform A [Clunio marinus]